MGIARHVDIADCIHGHRLRLGAVVAAEQRGVHETAGRVELGHKRIDIRTVKHPVEGVRRRRKVRGPGATDHNRVPEAVERKGAGLVLAAATEIGGPDKRGSIRTQPRNEGIKPAAVGRGVVRTGHDREIKGLGRAAHVRRAAGINRDRGTAVRRVVCGVLVARSAKERRIAQARIDDERLCPIVGVHLKAVAEITDHSVPAPDQIALAGLLLIGERPRIADRPQRRADEQRPVALKRQIVGTTIGQPDVLHPRPRSDDELILELVSGTAKDQIDPGPETAIANA